MSHLSPAAHAELYGADASVTALGQSQRIPCHLRGGPRWPRSCMSRPVLAAVARPPSDVGPPQLRSPASDAPLREVSTLRAEGGVLTEPRAYSGMICGMGKALTRKQTAALERVRGEELTASTGCIRSPIAALPVVSCTLANLRGCLDVPSHRRGHWFDPSIAHPGHKGFPVPPGARAHHMIECLPPPNSLDTVDVVARGHRMIIWARHEPDMITRWPLCHAATPKITECG